MTDEEFRAELLAASASRAEVQCCGLREAFTIEVLERLRDASEVPDAEPCAESLSGQYGRRLEIDAWSDDDADGSLQLFVAIHDGMPEMPEPLTLTAAREQGFNRLLGMFEQAREGWLCANIEESRPLWALARRVAKSPPPSALRLHVLTDRRVGERLREIPGDTTREGVPVTFQIWDVSRLKRVHEASSARDDLVVDFGGLAEGGLPVLPASVESTDYRGFLSVIPGEALAGIYVRHGSRLLEGNVRTFLGRSGRVNRGIAETIRKSAGRFFAFNNGIAATASAVTTATSRGGTLVITSATDLQIVNGAQTTASLAAALRDGSLAPGTVFVPMKISVVTMSAADELIPQISRYANSQNGVRPSDFFANHPFHLRFEEASRRILAPSVAGSQVQTHWYYERARGQHLNDQAGMGAAQRRTFLLMNPRSQVITKTDLAKVVCSFGEEPDIACKGAEKAFISFAERIAAEWADEAKRERIGDDWFRSTVAMVVLFRAAEGIVSRADWYEGGYRAQIVAYSCARLSRLARDLGGAGLDLLRIWRQQIAGPVIESQIASISTQMAAVLRSPPQAGQNVTEWAKQQACRKKALETPVDMVPGMEDWILAAEDHRAEARAGRRSRRVDDGLEAINAVAKRDAASWQSLQEFCIRKRMVEPADEVALGIACRIPAAMPTDRQAARLLKLLARASDAGWKGR